MIRAHSKDRGANKNILSALVKNVNPTRTAAQKFAERAEQNGASQEGVADVFFRIGDKDGFGFSN